MWSRPDESLVIAPRRSTRCSGGAQRTCRVLVLVCAVTTCGCTWDWQLLENGSDAGTDPGTDAAPGVTVDLDTSSVCVPAGGALTLTWSSTGATSCEAEGPGFSGARPVEGSEDVVEPTGGDYAIRCRGPGGEDAASVTVLVDPGATSDIRAPYGARDLADTASVEWQTDRHLAEMVQDGDNPGSRDLVATFRVAWDLARLYVTVSVVDDDLQLVTGAAELDHDLVEVMINGRNDAPYRTPAGTLRFDVDDHRLAFSPEGVLWTTDPAQPRGTDVVSQAWPTASGYEMEIAVQWPFVVGADGHVPAPGDVIGFDVAVVDRDAGEDPPTVVVWRLTEFRWRNTEGWGTVALGCSL